MNELESSDLFEAAARATINERCASAYLHDVRGSMQALFSAFELLGRSARMGGGDAVRVEKACDLAKRAITHHEKSTMDILELLTLKHTEATTVDLAVLLRDATHFLRNDAANKSIVLRTATVPELNIRVARTRLQTMLVGLLAAAIDHSLPSTTLNIDAERVGDQAVVSLSSSAGYPGESWMIGNDRLPSQLRIDELPLLFARQTIASSGGRIEIDPGKGAGPTMRLYFPCVAS